MKNFFKIKIPESIKTILFRLIIVLIGLRFLGAFIDPDMWWHIRLGEQILNGSFISNLTFTCQNYLWINHSWLSDVLIAVFNQLFGLGGLSIFFALVFLTGIVFNFLSLKKILIQEKINISRTGILLYFIVFTLILASFIAIRPQVFTFLFINILLYFLLHFHFSNKINYKWLLGLFLLFVLWVNLHGGFLIGIALIAIFFLYYFIDILINLYKFDKNKIKEAFIKGRFLFILIILCLLATLINPFGLDLWKEAFTLILGSNNASFINEWRSLDIKSPYNLFYFLLFLFPLVVQIINKKSLLRLIILIPFGLISFYSIRYILPVSSIVILIAFVEGIILLSKIFKKIEQDKEIIKLLNILKVMIAAFVVVIGVVGAYISITFFQSLSNINDKNNVGMLIYPIEAKMHLIENQEVYKNLNFYNTYVWGGYLSYNLPDFKWFIDGRMPEWVCKGLVNKNLMLDYIEVEDLKKDWKTVLGKYNIGAIIVRTNSSISNVLIESNEWQINYTDKIATVFIKK